MRRSLFKLYFPWKGGGKEAIGARESRQGGGPQKPINLTTMGRAEMHESLKSVGQLLANYPLNTKSFRPLSNGAPSLYGSGYLATQNDLVACKRCPNDQFPLSRVP